MTQAKSRKVNRIAMYHDLSVELGKIEIQMENLGEKEIDQAMIAKRAKLQNALRHLAI